MDEVDCLFSFFIFRTLAVVILTGTVSSMVGVSSEIKFDEHCLGKGWI